MTDPINTYLERLSLQRHIQAELTTLGYPYILKQTENESVIEIQTYSIPFKIHINNSGNVSLDITWAGPSIQPEKTFQFINDFLGILNLQCPSFCTFKHQKL